MTRQLSDDPNLTPALPAPDDCDAFVVVSGTIRYDGELYDTGDEIDREYVAKHWESDGFSKYVPVDVEEDENGRISAVAHAPPSEYATPTSELEFQFRVPQESRQAQKVLNAVERYEEKLCDEATEDADE